MPRGIPNPKPENNAMDEPGAKEPVNALTEGEAEKPTEEVRQVVSRNIPVLTMPGKAIKVTEYGYDFQNIHIPVDVPVHVLAQAFVTRLGEGERPETASLAFLEAQAFINEYAATKSKQRVRVLNGVVQYGADSFTVPLINPEVILRVLEDRWRNDRGVKSYFAGAKQVSYARSFKSIKDTYALL